MSGFSGFVADIYTTAVAQPVEDMAARGKLTGMYGSQPALMRSRILAAIEQVGTTSHPFICPMY